MLDLRENIRVLHVEIENCWLQHCNALVSWVRPASRWRWYYWRL